MWMAKRIEQASPARKLSSPTTFSTRKSFLVEPPKPANAAPASVIQDAALKGICYKCKNPWFHAHKNVCKMSQRNQVQALQAISADTADIIYITEPDTNSEEETDTKEQPPLKISIHAVFGITIPKYTFTLSVLIGDKFATVDSGSTTTFMNPTFAARANCPLTSSPKLKVIMANGGHFTCYQCDYSIQGVPFTSDFRICS
jgi:hypothetical protein